MRRETGLKGKIARLIPAPHIKVVEMGKQAIAINVTLQNEADQGLVIRGHRWFVQYRYEETVIEIFEGVGAGGQEVILQPGQAFSYDTWLALPPGAVFNVSFFGHDSEGERFYQVIS